VKLEKLDHPILFVLFLFLALWGTAGVVTHASKRLGLHGVASAVQNP
jgi:hypothetical protein